MLLSAFNELAGINIQMPNKKRQNGHLDHTGTKTIKQRTRPRDFEEQVWTNLSTIVGLKSKLRKTLFPDPF